MLTSRNTCRTRQGVRAAFSLCDRKILLDNEFSRFADYRQGKVVPQPKKAVTRYTIKFWIQLGLETDKKLKTQAFFSPNSPQDTKQKIFTETNNMLEPINARVGPAHQHSPRDLLPSEPMQPTQSSDTQQKNVPVHAHLHLFQLSDPVRPVFRLRVLRRVLHRERGREEGYSL